MTESTGAIDPFSSKAWFASRTVWGGILAIAAPVVGLVFHVNVSDADSQQIATVLATMGAGVGGIIAIYGRVMATKAIGALMGLAVLSMALSACGGGLNTAASIGGIASGAKTAYDVASTVNSAAGVTVRVVCGGWGAYWKDEQAGKVITPVALTSAQEILYTLCKDDPIGDTPLETVLNGWSALQSLERAAKT